MSDEKWESKVKFAANKITLDMQDVVALLNAAEHYGFKDKVSHSWNEIRNEVDAIAATFPPPKGFDESKIKGSKKK